MAKYVKANEVKAGVTLFIVHPEFNFIEEAFVTKRPHMHTDEDTGYTYGLIFNYNRRIHAINSGKIAKYDNSWTKWKSEHHIYYFLSDAGIPNKSGGFKYPQFRRTFRTIEAALKYFNDMQNDPELLEHIMQKALEEHYFFDDSENMV